MRLIASLVILPLLISGHVNALNVHIEGRWQNGPAAVRLLYYEDAVTGKMADLKAPIDSLSYHFEFNLDLDRPVMLQISDQFFIVTPGDTVNVHVTGDEGNVTLRFEGPKRMEHSFLSRLKDALQLFPGSRYTIDTRSIEKYKGAATRHYDSCILFLQDDVAQSRVTKPFAKVAQAYLTTRYYADLLYPVSTGLITKEKLPQHYFELVDFSFFKTTELLGFREFILAASYYNNHYYAGIPPDKYYDSLSVASTIKAANRNFSGEVKDNLLLFIFTGLTQNGTEVNTAQIQTLYEYLAGVLNQEPKRIVQMQDLKHEFEITDKPLPQDVLDQQLTTRKGKTVFLKDVLGTNEVVYVDFWASWCGPCIGEMPSEQQLVTELEGKPIKFILISFDEDEKKWQKAITKMKMKGDHYLITEGFTSALAKYIPFKEIPRYMILDKQGRLKSREAPGPSSILKNKSVLLSLLE